MTFLKKIFYRSRHIILYSAVMAVLVFMLKWLQWEFLIKDNAIDIYFGLIAIFFTLLGVWVASQIVKPKIKKVIVEKKVYLSPKDDFNAHELRKFNLSDREYEVLQLLILGYSNAEIADCLSLSVSTIKTHVSNLFVKMQVKSRTQAVAKAKGLKISPH